MDLYSSFAGFVELLAPPGEVIVDDNLLGEHPWLKLMIEPVFLYGSLPRPPDLQSPVVLPSFLLDYCMELCWSILISHKMFRVSFVIQKKQIPDSTSQKLSLVCNVLLLLSHAQALHLVGYCSVVTRRCVHPVNPVLLLVVDGINVTLFFLLPCYVLLLVNLLNFEEMTSRSRCVPRQGELTVIIVDWLFKRHLSLLLHLPFAQVYDGVSLFYKEEDKPVAVTLYGNSKVAAGLLTNDNLALLLHGTGHFVGQEHVDDSDRLCTFIFGSLTRPPEAHYVFRFRPLTFT